MVFTGFVRTSKRRAYSGGVGNDGNDDTIILHVSHAMSHVSYITDFIF